MPLPDSVAHSIEGRLDRLPAPQRAALDLAAVIGRGVPFALWRRAGDRGAEALLSIGDELCRRGLLLGAEAEMAAGADYVFAHDQIRRVTYELLAGPRRRLYHARVAEGLARAAEEMGVPAEPGALAYHWTAAQVWDKAADYHQQAGDRAREVYANADALAHYSQALEALDRLPGPADLNQRYEILLAREAIHDLQGQREAQVKDLFALEGMVQAGGAPAQPEGQVGKTEGGTLPWIRRRIEVALRRAQYAMATADYAAAVSLAEGVVSQAASAGLGDLEAKGHYEWSMALLLMGQFEQARQRVDEALEQARREKFRDLEASALGLLTRLDLQQGRWAEARTRGGQAIPLFRERGDRRSESDIELAMGWAANWEGDYATAAAHFERSLRLARESGYLGGEGNALTGLGAAAGEPGDLVRCRSYFDQALLAFRETGDRNAEARTLSNLGFILDQLGAHVEAEHHFEQYLAISRDVGARQGEAVALYNLAHVYQRQGRYERALQRARQALEIADEIGEHRVQGYAWTAVGCVQASLGRLAEAESAFQQALAVRRELGQPTVAMESLAGLVRVALAREDMGQASAYVAEILDHLKTGSLGGCKDPLLVYLSCYQALHAVHDPGAEQILTEAYKQLQEQAALITDDGLRRAYLEEIDAHREIAAAYHAWQSRQPGGPVSVRLPRAGAPLRRALDEDDYVTIVWTPDAPEDTGLASAVERRRQRLLRLAHQASEQGAAPTVDDLARTLEASAATIKRDLAALRQRGHCVKTRGSRQ
jgi:tetratricopeptide (TPR) repeat protein